MAELSDKLPGARRALDSFLAFSDRAGESQEASDIATYRFVLAIEAILKAAKAAIHGSGPERPPPYGTRTIVRESTVAGWLDDAGAKLMLQAVEDRNLAVHVYKPEQAQIVAGRLPDYATVMRRWLA